MLFSLESETVDLRQNFEGSGNEGSSEYDEDYETSGLPPCDVTGTYYEHVWSLRLLEKPTPLIILCVIVYLSFYTF